MRLFSDSSVSKQASVNEQRLSTSSQRISLFGNQVVNAMPLRSEYALAEERASLAEIVTSYKEADGLKRSALGATSDVRVASKPGLGLNLKEQDEGSTLSLLSGLAQTAADFITPRLSLFGALAPRTAGRSGLDYLQYLSPAQRKMYYDEGYRLFINKTIAAELNSFAKQYDTKVMTAQEILDLAKRFDLLFSPAMRVFEQLVSSEWIIEVGNSKVMSRKYEWGLYARHDLGSIGGMRGGGYDPKTKRPTYNFCGITQFGPKTYPDVLRQATAWGVRLPSTMWGMNFAEQIIAAYVYAIMNQPALVVRRIPVSETTLYICHNQGAGVWGRVGEPATKPKAIKKLHFNGQSAAVKRLLKSYGFYPV